MPVSEPSHCSWWHLSFLPPLNLDTLSPQCPHGEDAPRSAKDALCLQNNVVPHHAAPPPRDWLCVVPSPHTAVVLAPASLLFSLRSAFAFAVPVGRQALTPIVFSWAFHWLSLHFIQKAFPDQAPCMSPWCAYGPVVFLGSL